MAFHQPLVPVLPVARELFSKTKFIPSKSTSQNDPRPSSRKFILRGKKTDATIRGLALRRSSSNEGIHGDALTLDNNLTGVVLVDEPESAELDSLEESLGMKRQQRRPRLLSMFGRGKHEGRSVSLPQGEQCSPEDPLQAPTAQN